MESRTERYAIINFLEQHAEDRAMLAALRRGLSKMPGDAPEMFPYVVPFVRNEYEEADYYAIASLFALHPKSVATGNIGNHLRAYIKEVGDDEATTRRFVQLLRMRRETLDTPLRQHISLLKAKEIAVNWNQLLYDLRYWSHPNRFVQKNWATSFWA